MPHWARRTTEGTEPPPPPAPNTQLSQQLRDLTTERYSETLLNVLDLLLVLIERTVSTHAYLTDAMANYAAARAELLAAPRLVPVVAAPDGAGLEDGGPTAAATTDAGGGAAAAAPVPGLLAEEQRELLAVDVSLVEWARSAAPLDPQLQLDSEDIIQAVCDMAHMRVARLLAIRKEVRPMLAPHARVGRRSVLTPRTGCVARCCPPPPQSLAKMAPKDFFSLYHITVEFITKLEQYNTRHIATLRGALAAQCKSFLHAFHTDKITVMSMLLENEQWEVAVVPREFQAMVDTLASPTTVAAAALAAQTTHAGGSAAGDGSNGAPAAPPSETLLVGNERCYVVSAVLMAVKFLVEYVAIAVSVPSVVVDVVQRTVEFLQVTSRRARVAAWDGAR